MNGCTGELVLPRSEHVHGDADRASAATSTNVRQRLHGLPACRIPVRQKYDSTSCYIAYRHYLPPLSQRSITYFPRFYCYPSFSSPLFVHPHSLARGKAGIMVGLNVKCSQEFATISERFRYQFLYTHMLFYG